MFRKLATALQLILISTFVLPSCSSAATDTPNQFDGQNLLDTPEPLEVPLEGTIKVWSLTNEPYTMAIVYEGKNPDVDIEFTTISTLDWYDFIEKVGTAEGPDVLFMGGGYVYEWIDSDLLMDISDLSPLAQDMKTYPSVIEVFQRKGISTAYSYQSTPGGFFYRRGIAKECFGTDDPAEVQTLVADIDKFIKAASLIKDCGKGNYYIVGSADEMFNPFMNNRANPWTVDNALVIDPMVNEFVDFARLMRSEDYEAQVPKWSEDYFSSMNDTLVDSEGIPKKIFGYFLPTWGLNYVLMPNSFNEEAGKDTSGDWAMVEGPLTYFEGGTWVGVVDGSPNADLAKDFVRFVTLDEGNLTNWATGVYNNEYLKAIDPETPDDLAQPAGDFVSSQVVVEKIADEFYDTEETRWLGGQNYYEAFGNIAPKVNGALMTSSDDTIQRALLSTLEKYLTDEVTKEEMWTIWLESVRNEFPDLIIPELPPEYLEE